ncbi:hypothetical protein K7432_015697 [Basidiobolus ranarum]|uniref:HPP transmembrane region domain-containing protein n=1 Tax=Basidiobolus ranarum TaxID=34480 RepID=A0ABR2VNK9_9FUNG
MEFWNTYFNKLLKYPRTPFPPMSPLSHILGSFLATFTGISIVGLLTWEANIFSSYNNAPVILGAFGASSVLIYVALESPLAQPYNAFVGGTISGFIGISVGKVFDALCEHNTDYLWLQCALAVSLAIVGMMLTRSVHPPGAATALISVTSGQHIRDIGYFFIVSPILLGTTIMIIVAVLFNNVLRKYPMYWIFHKPKPMEFDGIKVSNSLTSATKPSQDINIPMTETTPSFASEIKLEAAERRIRELEEKIAMLESCSVTQ